VQKREQIQAEGIKDIFHEIKAESVPNLGKEMNI
jgi:hypothetical protein